VDGRGVGGGCNCGSSLVLLQEEGSLQIQERSNKLTGSGFGSS
jgi:hypothetical protein